MKKVIAAAEAWYDEDKKLFYCYIGLDNKNKTLIASVYGNTSRHAIENAEVAAAIFNLHSKKE